MMMMKRDHWCAASSLVSEALAVAENLGTVATSLLRVMSLNFT